MKHTKAALTSLAIAAVLAGGVGAVSAREPQNRDGQTQQRAPWGQHSQEQMHSKQTGMRSKMHFKPNKMLQHPWHKEMQQSIKNALENGDYEAFRQAHEDAHKKQMEYLTEERFQQLLKLRQLREEGDMESARRLMDQMRIEREALMQQQAA
ncbi:hypothetical protein H6758_01070 [Candidatus Nomurabacteria bacterium]|nr:hypothetical protein [Candidatus Nomurabacteria bacterium]